MDFRKPYVLAIIIQCIVFFINLCPVCSQPNFACNVTDNPGFMNFTFCNASLDVNTRVTDLVGRLTLSEKISWLVHQSAALDKLGIPDYNWWSEALHGVSSVGGGSGFSSLVPGATSFGQVILTAATFNESLFEIIGQVISNEARAMHNIGLAGLTFWSPNVNIVRDPRWGRIQETPGEDPFLTSKYAVAFVKGMQQQDNGNKDRLKVAACCKHYTAYDVDNWKGVKRTEFNALVTQQDLEDTFNPPFRSCVIDGNVASVMCSYNQVNGKPTCANPDLFGGVVRGQWKLNGYLVTDCDSLLEMFKTQNYTKTPEETIALALNSGVDLNCGSFLQQHTQAAIDKNLINETVVNTAVTNNFATLMRLGFFDGDPTKGPYGALGPNDVCTPANQELAREAARQGIVLLKNTEGSLPLSPTAIKSLALIGPNANVTEPMIGNYNGMPCKYITPLQGITTFVNNTVYQPGCSKVSCASPQVEDAKNIAANADAVILVMGSDQSIEAESLDRVDLTLPGQQQLLITEVANVSKGPVILVIMSAGGMDVQFAKDNPKITSILWVGFPGEAGGGAIADVIFGLHNPSGRLPVSWYPQSYAETVNMTDMNMRPDPARGYPGRTYRFYNGPTVFTFGDGLSYSTFMHNLVKAPKLLTMSSLFSTDQKFLSSNKFKSIPSEGAICKNLTFDLELSVKNEGPIIGSYTVLLFSSPPQLHNAPQKQLIGFQKLHLAPNAVETVKFNVDGCRDLSIVDEEGRHKIALGEYVLYVGDVKHNVTLVF